MEEISKKIRKDILQASYDAGACHIGSALSCVDILVDLFYKKKIKPENFYFAKASGVGAYYAVLSDLGYFPKDKLARYLKDYPLPHTAVPGITHSFGSVGHGLSVAAGVALGSEEDIYVLLSDGDMQEGSTMEAALFIHQHRIHNLHVIVDDNGLQAGGTTSEILEWHVGLFDDSIMHFNRRSTIKGKGVDFMENDYTWHYKNLTSTLLNNALKQIDG